ncbi:MAG: DNA repair protein RecO [Aestuariibacter sp.]
MRQYQIDCYLLHSRHYRETSIIATAFSRELGKVSFVVKGARSKKNSSGSLLLPFVPLQLQLHGQSELKNGTKIELQGKALSLTGRHLYSGMYLNEILIRTLPIEESMSELYDSYSDTLRALLSGLDIEPVLRNFEFKLLQTLGYAIDFNCDAVSQTPLNPDHYYQFHPELGFRLTTQPRDALSGEAILQVARQNWTVEALKVAKYVARSALTPLLGHKPLKSRELFR